MGDIVRLNVVRENTQVAIEASVMNVVRYFQSLGLHVEIQYAHNERAYSAMVIGRNSLWNFHWSLCGFWLLYQSYLLLHLHISVRQLHFL